MFTNLPKCFQILEFRGYIWNNYKKYIEINTDKPSITLVTKVRREQTTGLIVHKFVQKRQHS